MVHASFPLNLVERHNERTSVEKACRLPGSWVGTGDLQLGGQIAECRYSYSGEAEDQVTKLIRLYQRGLEYISAHGNNQAVLEALEKAREQKSNLSVAWMKNHNTLAEILSEAGDRMVRMDISWVEHFGLVPEGDSLRATDERVLHGLTVLSALIQVYVLNIAAGKAQREALHALLDYSSLIPDSDREALLEVLRSKYLDSNNTFNIFLTYSHDPALAQELEQLDLEPMRGVRTALLFETGNQIEQELFRCRREGGESTVDLHSTVQTLAGKRNGIIISEEEIQDFSSRIQQYIQGKNGEAVQDVVSLVEKTLRWRDKWVTWLIGQLRVDTPYDMSRVVRLMQEDIEDIDEKRALINEAISTTYDMELEGGNIERIRQWARDNGMKLVAGRLSRAFGNQSQLLSVSKILADKEGLLPYAKKLHQASMSVRALQTQATRILHLIQQHKPTPFAQTVGALNQFEEALFEYQSKEFKRMLQEKDDASRRVIGRPDAEMCGSVLDTIQQRIRNLYQVAAEFRDQLERTEKKPAAFIILLQRLHPAETVNLANANLLRDVHPGKEEDLRDLMRQGGHYTYSSQGMGKLAEGEEVKDTHWIIEVDDWIEAIPLFIHERVVTRRIKTGEGEIDIEVIETEVDQEAMEVFFRLHAEFWAQNIDAVVDSQHLGLARRLMVRNDAELSRAAEEHRRENPDQSEDHAAQFVLKSRKDLYDGIAALAALITDYYRSNVEQINRTVEQKNIERAEAVEQVLLGEQNADITTILQAGNAVAIAEAALTLVQKGGKGLADTVKRMRPNAAEPTRRTPSLHILTTESAGMTEGYVQTWIEEEMALYNVIKNEGLESEVKDLMNQFRTRMQAVARKVIAEFGMSVVIEEVMAQQRLPEPAAVMTVLMSFKPVYQEAAKLAVLIEQAEARKLREVNYENAEDPKAVDQYIEKHAKELLEIAVPKVALNNGKAFEQKVQEFRERKLGTSLFELQRKVIESEQDYAEELEAFIRFEARSRILEQWDQEEPNLFLPEQVRTYIRIHTALAKSTARKEVIASHQLNQSTMHPLNYYQATGGNKRYNLLYTPSRVNLGERERDSVVKWRQWVGGADRFAAQAGFEFYSLINEGGVEERPALAYAEIQKTSENALCVTHFAGSNALALLCMAVLEGDAEDMADQMNLRNDRMIPPAGEGYGGYCVPKDGLFLAFVLSLQNDVKLRQMGISERYHEGVMKMAKTVLLRQNDFESHFDWQRWAAEKLLAYTELKKFFDIKDNLLVFHISKVARAIENLGQPWHETAEGTKLVANLAAQWGVEKMIIRAEQVNRFMVFYKAWMIYDSIREARLENPNCPPEEEARIALTAEYKPVQDIRYSTGMRLFEILAQTGEHLTHSLDEEGQNLVYLMNYGFDPQTTHPVGRRAVNHIFKTFYIDPGNQETIERLKQAFPGHRAPGDLVMTSVTMSSTQDMLHYTSDTRLEEIANQVQVILGDYGLTEDQIRANATVHGGRLQRWAGIKELPQEEQDDLIRRVGGQIHALVLQMRGPGRDYEKDVQGIDVLNAGIPFPELLDLLDNMPKLVFLMRNGNPNSCLAITDGAAGRARRLLTYFDVQAFFAACEKIGRRGVYKAVGLGRHNIDRLRQEMQRKRERAERLYAAVAAVAQAGEQERAELAQKAASLYRQLSDQITADDEAGKALREEEKLKRYRKWKVRDYYISQALARISAGLPIQTLDFGTWVAGIGGVFVITNEAVETIEKRRKLWDQGIALIAGICPEDTHSEAKPFGENALNELWKHLVRPEYVPESQRFAQQMLVESSSKAVEIAAREALERRKALKVRAERARAFNDREDGFRDVFHADQIPAFEDCWNESQQILSQMTQDLETIYAMSGDDEQRPELQSRLNRNFGKIVGYTRASFTRLVRDIMPEENDLQREAKRQILDDLSTVYTGREIILEELKKLMGGYEDIGGIARLAEAAQGDRALLETIAKAIELFYITFALAQTLEFALQLPDEVDPAVFWKNIVDYFAESINDHWYEYWPWAYARGVGFRDIPTEEKYALAVERHKWLYHYLRLLLVERTELREWSEADRDALLGNFSGNARVVAIGANGTSEVERAWRAYNQLREITFVKSDGFPLPEVFHEFDPAIIDADNRVNVGILFPVGRTHVSRALREGPTLTRQMEANGEPGTNIIITRHNDFVEVEGAQRKALLITDGHLYISEKEYEAALEKSGKLESTQVKQAIEQARAEGRLTPKGIRIAARFGSADNPKPIVAGVLIPFHGQPVYVSGQSEEQGVPATIQSLIYTDITYDKSLYPAIYTEQTGVHLPPEIDWLNVWNQGLSSDEVLNRIREGYSEKSFRGLREFGYEHPIILIKGAAESGARNLKVFEVQDEFAQIKEDALNDAARFVYDVSRGQNVVIQAAVFTNPELWASPELMESFIDRQILDWNTPVNRDSYPRSQIYGTMRIVVSSSSPDQPYDTAFPISLMSLQVATNVGRGGTLEPLRPEHVQEQFREQIMNGLRAEGPKVMNALNAYVKDHATEWEQQSGQVLREDLRGVSYGWANYLMCDYVIMPVFERRGRLVDILPVFDDNGRRIASKPILQDEEGRFEGRIIDWKFIHLEPNVGIGLWDRYNLREEIYEAKHSTASGKPYNWDNVGQSDRIVLRNFVLSGRDYLKANFPSGIRRDEVNRALKK